MHGQRDATGTTLRQKLRWPIRLKVASGGVVVALLISVFVGWYHPSKFERDALDAKRQQVAGSTEMVALSVSIGMRFQEPSAVASAFAWARRDSALAYIAVVDTAGALFAQFNPDSLSLSPAEQARRPDVREHAGLYIAAAPIRYQDVLLGHLVLGSSLEPIHARIQQQRRVGLGVSAIIFTVGIAISLYIAGLITRPIIALQRAADRIAEGNYVTEVEATTHDEVGVLAHAFASMATKIRTQVNTLAHQAEELADARDLAVAAAQAKSAFLATMSHEIRTPMNGVLGMLDLLREGPLTPEQRGFADTAYLSADALLTIINDVLDFSKIEAGRLTLEQVAFDPHTLIEDVASLLADAAETKGLELVVHVSSAVPSAVIGDPLRTRQILLNFAGNAIKFTEEGEVVLHASARPVGDADVELVFEVSDTGIGLSPADQSKLFQSFVQADSSTTRRYGGTGLGLVICRQLVTLMQGEVILRSEVGVGSTFGFNVRVPVAPSAKTVEAQRPLAGRHVVIVDDNLSCRRSLQQTLTALGAECIPYANAETALGTLRDSVRHGRRPDAVIVDADMPLVGGLAFCGAMRADPSLAEIRTVLLTTLRKRQHVLAESAGLPFTHVLSKPVRSSQLQELVVRAITGERAATAGDVADTRQGSSVAETAETPERTSANRGHLLLAEDNVVNQRVAMEALKRLGYTVTVVEDGMAAVDAVGKAKYDAVLMDCQMPRMDGLRATEEIRRRGFDSSVLPIIAMTASAMEEDRARCLAAGMDDYTTKPLRRNVLAAVLDQWVGVRASAPDDAAAVPTDAPPASTFDEQQLAAVVGDDRETQRYFLELFLETSGPVLGALETALVARQESGVRSASHQLHGSAASLGLVEIAACALRLEHRLPGASWEDVAQDELLLREAFGRAITLVDEF